MRPSSRTNLMGIALLLALSAPALRAAPFTYEGSLTDLGRPATGRYDLRLTAYGHAQLDTTLAAPISFYAVDVRDGRFRLDLDLPVSSDAVWLGVAVRPEGAGAFSAINGRSKAIAAPLIGQCWSTLGDTASNPAINFIGTTDAQAFVVRTQNVRSLRIEPSTALFGGSPITSSTLAGSSANRISIGVRGATIAGGGVPTGDSDPDYDTEAPNLVYDHYGTVGGGYGNEAGSGVGFFIDDQPFATVAGGFNNTAYEIYSTVGGGTLNRAVGERSTIGGGESNYASGGFGTIGGGFDNIASGQRSSIGGGESNNASDFAGTVGGGFDNSALGSESTIGGGSDNSANGLRSTIGGGISNRALSERSTVGGGALNTASAVTTTISGGRQNMASGASSTVIGGSDNTASGDNSTVGGGFGNCAGGAYSWAAGRRAKIRPGSSSGSVGIACSGVPESGTTGDAGTFAWADSQAADLASTGDNQFIVRALGGIYLGTTSTVSLPSTRFINTSTGAFLSAGGTWTNASSRVLKTDFAAIDPADVLDRLTRLDISTWAYRGSSEGRHLGPVAEEFREMFGLGSDGTSISTVDASGVALAAIQGLNTKLEAENAALKSESAALRARLDRLEALMVE
jgi:trimeric autotransporter adhesin